jgi:hypothetical protein
MGYDAGVTGPAVPGPATLTLPVFGAPVLIAAAS